MSENTKLPPKQPESQPQQPQQPPQPADEMSDDQLEQVSGGLYAADGDFKGKGEYKPGG